MASVHIHLLSVGNAPGPVLNPEEMGITMTVTVTVTVSWILEDNERTSH